MSLKAKIEAIIYAAEEPVTLLQLVGLLGEEAQAELDALAARQADLPLDDTIPLPSEPDVLNEEVLEPPVTDDDLAALDQDAPALDGDQHGFSDTAVPGGNTPSSPSELPAEEPAPPAAQPDLDPASSPDPPVPDPPIPDPVAPTADDKKLARERERLIRQHLRSLLDELIRDYITSDRGLEIREVASGFRLSTKPEYHDAVRGFARSLKPPLKLSLQALETLAVVAYKQPITAPEVAEIRGVDSGGVLAGLMTRKLVTTAGRKQVVGRPILYKTTKDFLLRFGLRDINELPGIEEFERMAGELADAEPLQEEIPMPDATTRPTDLVAADLQEEATAAEPQADGDSQEEVAASIPVDGRISAPPTPEDISVDSSAGDAAIQADEQAAQNE